MKKYRPDIDGLRAIAILSVLVFHVFPRSLPGGYAGVDVFFVISGYLISSIMLKEMNNGTFTFADFYARRVKRIFPALILVFLSSIIFGFFYLFPNDLALMGKHIFSGTLFASNLTLLSEAGYFDSSADLKPFLHLWSLAIEEQFYIFWPLALSFLFKRSSLLFKTLIAATGISFFLNVFFVKSHPSVVFYLPFFRFWEIFAGVIVAYIESKKELSESNSNVRSFIGFTMIALAIGFLKPTSVFPGWWALLPVVGTALMISSPAGWINRKLLENKWMVFVGLISYPLYLWHWPVIVFYRQTNGDEAKSWIAISLMLISIVLAYVTYRFLEAPLKKIQVSNFPFKLSVLMGAIAVISVCTFIYKGYPHRFPLEIQQLASISDPYKYFEYQKYTRGGICHDPRSNLSIEELEKSCISQGNELLFLWGDSFAASLYPGLKKYCEEKKCRLAQFTVGNAPPFISDKIGANGMSMNEIASRNFKLIQKYRPTKVILAWMFSAKNTPKPNETVKELDTTINAIQSVSPNTEVIIIGPLPQWEIGIISLYLFHWKKFNKLPDQYTEFKANKNISTYDLILEQGLKKNQRVKYISTLPYLCNSKGCQTRTSPSLESISYVDFGHLSKSGAENLIFKIRAEI